MVGHTYIKYVGQYVGQEVELRGWLYNKRSSGKIQFLLVRDRTGIIQGLCSRTRSHRRCSRPQEGSPKNPLLGVGVVRADERAPSGYELTLTNLEVVQLAEEYPITPKEHGVEFHEPSPLVAPFPKTAAIMKVRHEVIRQPEIFWITGVHLDRCPDLDFHRC